MTPKEARRSDRFTQLAVAAATQAAEEAGCPTASTPSALGVLIGTGVGGLETLERAVPQPGFEGGERAVSPHFVPMMMPNAAAGADRDAPRRARPRVLRRARRARRAPTRSARPRA